MRGAIVIYPNGDVVVLATKSSVAAADENPEHVWERRGSGPETAKLVEEMFHDVEKAKVHIPNGKKRWNGHGMETRDIVTALQDHNLPSLIQ